MDGEANGGSSSSVHVILRTVVPTVVVSLTVVPYIPPPAKMGALSLVLTTFTKMVALLES